MARSAKKTMHSKVAAPAAMQMALRVCIEALPRLAFPPSGVFKLNVVADDVFRMLDRSEENAQCRRELVALLRAHFGAKRTADSLGRYVRRMTIQPHVATARIANRNIA